MHARMKKGIVIGFVLYLAFFLFFFVMKKDQKFSPLENRALENRPILEKEALFSGEFTASFETYVADQFPLRDEMIAIKSNIERILGKKDRNGVFIGKDNHLIQDFKKPDMNLLKKNMGYIETFAKVLPTYVMIAPTATKIWEEKLPKFADPYDEGLVLQQIQKQTTSAHFVDVLPVMESHSEESIYYKTDHHWTTRGAYYAYTAFCQAYGIEPLSLDQFEIEQASTKFYGTLFSKGNFTFVKPDTLEIFHRDGEEQVSVYDLNANDMKDSMYERRFLREKDQYGVFLNQNQPLLILRTDVANGKKLMVVKDSYANCLIPFLTAHFAEIHVMDVRLLNLPLLDYAQAEGISETLILYNVQNFSEETRLSLLKY